MVVLGGKSTQYLVVWRVVSFPVLLSCWIVHRLLYFSLYPAPCVWASLWSTAQCKQAGLGRTFSVDVLWRDPGENCPGNYVLFRLNYALKFYTYVWCRTYYTIGLRNVCVSLQLSALPFFPTHTPTLSMRFIRHQSFSADPFIFAMVCAFPICVCFSGIHFLPSCFLFCFTPSLQPWNGIRLSFMWYTIAHRKQSSFTLPSDNPRQVRCLHYGRVHLLLLRSRGPLLLCTVVVSIPVSRLCFLSASISCWRCRFSFPPDFDCWLRWWIDYLFSN